MAGLGLSFNLDLASANDKTKKERRKKVQANVVILSAQYVLKKNYARRFIEQHNPNKLAGDFKIKLMT